MIKQKLAERYRSKRAISEASSEGLIKGLIDPEGEAEWVYLIQKNKDGSLHILPSGQINWRELRAVLEEQYRQLLESAIKSWSRGEQNK
jgi:hypothetical protein